jgi:tRNA A-37 threonylcarbamoyl transferase component Bud32
MPDASPPTPQPSSPETAAWLEALLDEEPEAPLRVGPGRATWSARRPDGLRVVVKRQRGEVAGEGRLSRLVRGERRSPARRERDALAALAALGVAVPRPLHLHERGPDSLVVMERLEHAESLRERLRREPAAAAGFVDELLELVRGLHRAGWYHRDLDLDHVLPVEPSGRLHLIDLGRARRDARPRARWFVKDLAALWHSTPEGVPPRLALRFLARWLDAHGVRGRSERRRWLRAVRRRARRMAAHAPRGGQSFPSPERPGEGA